MPGLEIHELTRTGLDPVSLRLDSGECLAITGPSGSGKSLLLRAVADLDPNQGTILLDDRSRDAMPAPEWRRRVAYVPAETGWWADTVGAHFPDWNRAGPYLECLDIRQEARNWQIARLSTGERQRLGLVRSLVLSPRVLLLDEPTASLDDDTSMAVEAMIAEFRAGDGIVLWVTHDDDQAGRIALRRLNIAGGRAAEVAR